MASLRLFSVTPLKPFREGKSRLSSILTMDQRIELSRCMLKDVFAVLSISKAFEKSILVTSERESLEIASEFGIEVLWEDRPSGVNEAVGRGTKKSYLEGAHACVVIAADLPLLSPKDLRKVVEMAGKHEDGDGEDDGAVVIISPSLRFDGTNILLRKPPEVIRTWYDENSFANHVTEALERDVELKIYCERGAILDIDLSEDIESFIKVAKSNEKAHLSQTYMYLKESLNIIGDMKRMGS